MAAEDIACSNGRCRMAIGANDQAVLASSWEAVQSMRFMEAEAIASRSGACTTDRRENDHAGFAKACAVKCLLGLLAAAAIA